MARNSYTKGPYRPKNPQKYKGDPTKIVFRSSWELQMFIRCDNDKNILAWSSEEVVIPYFYEVDQKWHRYFMDIWCKVRQPDGTIIERLIEIKPAKQTRAPAVQKRQTKRYITEVTTYIKNKAKWEAAYKYCKQRGMSFYICTEKGSYEYKRIQGTI